MIKGTGLPGLGLERLGSPVPFVPVPLWRPDSELPGAGLSQSSLQNTFYLREACCPASHF